MLHISIHSSAKPETIHAQAEGTTALFQSTPARSRRRKTLNPSKATPPFQSTPARSRRHGGCLSMGKPGNFNPLQREAGDEIYRIIITGESYISIHSSAKPETPTVAKADDSTGISIHSSAKPETIVPGSLHLTDNFNPLQREAGDVAIEDFTDFASIISIHSSAKPETSGFGSGFISIHSSAKPETKLTFTLSDIYDISIHSSAKPETFQLSSISPFIAYFNPLQREAGDSKAMTSCPL